MMLEVCSIFILRGEEVEWQGGGSKGGICVMGMFCFLSCSVIMGRLLWERSLWAGHLLILEFFYVIIHIKFIKNPVMTPLPPPQAYRVKSKFIGSSRWPAQFSGLSLAVPCVCSLYSFWILQLPDKGQYVWQLMTRSFCRWMNDQGW